MQGVNGLKSNILMMCMFIFLSSGCSSVAGNTIDQTIKDKPVMAQTNEKKDTGIKEVRDEQVDVQLYFGDSENAMLRKEKRTVSLRKVLADSPRSIILELMKGPTEKNLFPVIPTGTKLLSIIKEGDIITVNFSKEFRDNHNGGSAGETMTIYAIVNSLTELMDVEKVQFQIEGKTEEEFKGHFEFDKPFVRDESLVAQ